MSFPVALFLGELMITSPIIITVIIIYFFIKKENKVRKEKCKKCTSCIGNYCIEEMKPTKEVKDCKKFIDRKQADFLCSLMCDSDCEE